MKKFQIAFVGINSLYGSTSALLLKQSPFIKCLKLFDPRDVESGLDVATINTQCKVKTFQGHDQLENAFREVDIIVISDESISEMVDSDTHLMNMSANLTKYAKAISRASPNAIVVVASPPVNCLLPIMSQLLAKAGCYNHNKVVGSTSVDTMRASALLASHLNMNPKEVVLPVIGGGSESTRVPVFSQSRPHFSLKKDLKNNLIMDIRRGDSLVLANTGRPEAMNRAYSTVRFLNSIMAGLRGDPNVTDITLCRTDLVPGVEYFSLPVMFGREGIIKRFGVPNTSATEDEMVEAAIKHVKKDTDKADYIVKGTIELPEHKYLTANERASSQKDMFDLFVKSLPKPQDKNQDTTDSILKKAADYSFKSLIKEDPRRGPFEVFDKKSHRHTLANKLKNVTSADSFLKSAGCYTSALHTPIHIMEPLGCPSRPLETDEDRELEQFLESDDVLHENSLARFREKETYGGGRNQKFSPSPTKNQPLFVSAEMVQQKTVDPIANFKAQIAKFHEYRKHESNTEVDGNQLDEGTSTCEVIEAVEDRERHTDYKTGSPSSNGTNMAWNKKKVRCKNENRNLASTPKLDEHFGEHASPNEKEVHFSSPSGRCMKKKYGSSNETDSYVFDVKTNRIIPPYNLYKKGKRGKVNYIPEVENGKSYMPSCGIEESVYKRGGLEGMGNDEKYDKLVSRLFKKLNGLNDELYFPLKASGEERVNVPKCSKSFTDSAVRCRLPNRVPLKIRKKHKKSITAMESGRSEDFEQEMTIPKKKSRQSEENLMQQMGSHSKRSQKETAEFKDIEDEASHSHEHQEGKLCENDELQFVCPKCQIKITCQPEKNRKDTKTQIPEREVSDIPQQDERKTKRNVIMKSYKVRDSQSSTQNEVFTAKTLCEDNLQEERLKRLKEKINKKLIPMMRQGPGSAQGKDKDDLLATAPIIQVVPKSAKDLEISESNSRAREMGTPLVLVKNSEHHTKHSIVPEVKSNPSEKWQGVPFVVKRNEKKSENKDVKHRALFMKLVAPPAFKINPKGEDKVMTGQAKKTDAEIVAKADCSSRVSTEGKYTEETQKPVDSDGKAGKRAAKILNKLQLLEVEGKRKINMEGSKSEMEKKEESDTFHKEQLRREISVDLKADEVRKYMMTRQRDSRNVLVKESSNKKVEETTQAVFEKIDLGHLKPVIDKNVTSDILSEPKPARHEADKSQMASDANKLEQIANNTDVKNKESMTKNEAAAVESKAAVSSENQVLKDDKVGKNTGNDTKEPKTCVKEPILTMTSPSKNFENIEEPTMSSSKDYETNAPKASSKVLQASPKIQNVADEKSVQKLSDSAKLSSNPSAMVFHKTPNKLQLLARVRNSKQNDNAVFRIQLQRKLKNVWENVLSEKPVQNKFEPAELPRSLKHVGGAFDKLDKKSAAVRMAKKINYSVPKKSNLYRTKGVSNNVAVLDGLAFPARRKRKPTNNLLKNLASVSRRHDTSKPIKPKANLKGVVKRVPVKPLACMDLGKDRYRGIKPGTSLEPLSSEYAKDEMQMAKLASEILKKKTLRSAFDFKESRICSREWNHSKYTVNAQKTFSKAQRQQMPRNFVSVERPWSSLSELGTTKVRNGADAAQKLSDDVKNRLMSMPHVRHQVENFELPLGPLEVQPGLARFNHSKVGIFSPIKSDGSWESSIVNEYSRSNALPSLRDTRETFYLEEQPS